LLAIGVLVALVATIIAFQALIVTSPLVQFKSNSVFISTSSNNTPQVLFVNRNSKAE